MEKAHVLYKGNAFTLTGEAVRQDDSNWAEVYADGLVKTMKNGAYSEWRILSDAEDTPHYHGSFEVLNKAYSLALNEAASLLNGDGVCRTGDNWPTEWTRDISYSVHLGLGLWNIQTCIKSLKARLKNKEVEQDTGTGGSWPISSDRVVWGLAAWEVYCWTGDKVWLEEACRIVENTCKRDEQVITDTGGLMKGESSVLDWREQTYPAWMTAADIGDSCSLSTMLLHMEVRHVLAHMFRELGQKEKAKAWQEKSMELKKVIERFLRLPGHILYGQYLYGRGYPVLSEKVDSLGNLLSVLTGQVSGSTAAELVANLPHCAYGIPCIHPQMPDDVPAYHNRAMWPLMEGYYAQAASLVGNQSAVALAIACLVRAALLCGTNKENILLETGLDEGLLLSSDRQLWSIAGMLGVFYKGLFGMHALSNELRFSPCVPTSFAGIHELSGVRYRDMIIDIALRGGGNRVKRCYINGQESAPVVSDDMKGRILVELELEEADEAVSTVNLTDMGDSLSYPVWKTSRQGIAWECVPGADYYRVYRNGIPISQTEQCYYIPSFVQENASFQVMAVSLDGRESYLNEPNDYPSADSHLETRPCGLSGDEVWLSRVSDSPDALCYNVNIENPGVYRVDAFFANGTYDVTDGNTCALRSLYLNGQRVGSLAFPHTSCVGNWDYFIYSTALDVVMTSGPCRVELVYDAFSENMNRFVNDMAIKHVRFTRIS